MNEQLVQLVYDIIESIQANDAICKEQILRKNPHVSLDDLALLSKQHAEHLEGLKMKFFTHYLPHQLYEIDIEGTDITPDHINSVSRVLRDTHCCSDGIITPRSLESYQLRLQPFPDSGFVLSRSKLQQLIEQSVRDVIEAYVKELVPGEKVSALSIA